MVADHECTPPMRHARTGTSVQGPLIPFGSVGRTWVCPVDRTRWRIVSVRGRFAHGFAPVWPRWEPVRRRFWFRPKHPRK
jgi:hypothetical protein